MALPFFFDGDEIKSDYREIKEGERMINFKKTKTRKTFAAIIIFVLIIAMVLPSIATIFTM